MGNSEWCAHAVRSKCTGGCERPGRSVCPGAPSCYSCRKIGATTLSFRVASMLGVRGRTNGRLRCTRGRYTSGRCIHRWPFCMAVAVQRADRVQRGLLVLQVCPLGFLGCCHLDRGCLARPRSVCCHPNGCNRHHPLVRPFSVRVAWFEIIPQMIRTFRYVHVRFGSLYWQFCNTIPLLCHSQPFAGNVYWYACCRSPVFNSVCICSDTNTNLHCLHIFNARYGALLHDIVRSIAFLLPLFCVYLRLLRSILHKRCEIICFC